MSKIFITLQFFLLAIVYSGLSHAAIVSGLYQSSVEIESQQASDRQEGFNKALLKTLLKLTGQPDIVNTPEIKRAFFPAERYVQSYSYKENPRLKAHQLAFSKKRSGNTEVQPSVGSYESLPLPYLLDVEFSSAAIDQKMKSLNLPVWGKIRPEIMLWALQENAGERRFLGKQTASEEIDIIRNFATQLSLPVIFPEADQIDTAALSMSDLWGQFTDALENAKTRYTANGHMMLRMLQLLDQQWTGNAYLSINGQAYRASFNSASKEEMYQKVMEFMANTLSNLFAVNVNSTNSQQVELEIRDVKSFISYIDVQNFLNQSPQIKSCLLKELAGSTMHLSCDLVSTLDKFNDYLNLSGKMRFISATQEASAPLIPMTGPVNEQAQLIDAKPMIQQDTPSVVIKEVYQWLFSPPDLK